MSPDASGAPSSEEVYALIVGKVIEHLRLRAGASQGELASRASMTQSTISRIENGKLTPDAHQLRSLAQGLGLGVVDLQQHIEDAMGRTQQTVEQALPEEPGGSWWVIAFAVAGIMGLIGLIAFGVSAALSDNEKAEPTPDPPPQDEVPTPSAQAPKSRRRPR